MFEIGSYVVYRSEGVCTVTDIRKESFGALGRSEEYYILTPLADKKSTVFVPINNPVLTSYMHKLLNASELSELIEECHEERLELPVDSRSRSTLFKEILFCGDRRQTMILLNTLADKYDAVAGKGRKLGTTELNAYTRAQRKLYEEFSATTDIASISDVIDVLRGNIVLSDKVLATIE